ncbi:MAG: hypothetical protein LUH22_09605 [Bacteroides sp.]|nr:hypothetical protein [Bacteroides sp.]
MKDREIVKGVISDVFCEVMSLLKDRYSLLTKDDLYCYVLFALGCKNVDVQALMGVGDGALKTRKSRIRKKMNNDEFTIILQG